MGFVDRGGGREAKGSSLRRSKKNPGAAATRNKDAHKNYATATVRTVPTPPLAIQAAMNAWASQWTNAGASTKTDAAAHDHAEDVRALVALAASLVGRTAGPHCFIDSAVALLSRKLEADQEGILRRAREEGELSSVICWCTEMERQTLLLETCANHNQLTLKDRTAAASKRGKGAASPSVVPAASKKAGAKKVHFAADGETEVEGSAKNARDGQSHAGETETLGLVKTTSAASAVTTEEDNGCILYCVIGVHVNNIDRTNKKVQEQWLGDVRETVKHPEVVGVLSGLNLSRDAGTHYAQEHLLKEMWRIAGEEKLPLVLHVYANDRASTTQTADRLAEILQELYASRCGDGAAAVGAPVALVLYNGLRLLTYSESLQQLVRTHRPSLKEEFASTSASAGPSIYVMATADGLTASADGAVESAVVDLLPASSLSEAVSATDGVVALSQLLIATGAPWSTPQNIEDEYVRTMPNEPGNFLYVARAIYDAMVSRSASASTTPVDQATVLQVALLNAVRVFFADCLHQQMDKAAKAAAREEARRVQNEASARLAEPHHDEADNDDKDSEEEDSDSGDRHVPRVHVPTGVALVDAPAAPVVAEDDSLDALLRQAAEERARLEREAAAEEEAAHSRAADDAGKKKKEKKKNVKKNNRSNFSTFRNKDFASRADKKSLQAQRDGNENESDDDSDDEHGNNAHRDATVRDAEADSCRSSSSDSRDGAPTRQAAKKGAKSAGAASHADPSAKEPTSAPKRGKAALAKSDEDEDEDEESDGEAAVTTMAPRKARKKKNKRFQKQIAQYQREKDGDDDSSDA